MITPVRGLFKRPVYTVSLSVCDSPASRVSFFGCFYLQFCLLAFSDWNLLFTVRLLAPATFRTPDYLYFCQHWTCLLPCKSQYLFLPALDLSSVSWTQTVPRLPRVFCVIGDSYERKCWLYLKTKAPFQFISNLLFSHLFLIFSFSLWLTFPCGMQGLCGI